jgi:protein SCO1
VIRTFALVFVVAAFALGGCRARGEPLPELGHIDDFKLTDQTGKPLSARDYEGSVWVGAFMFTRCPTICPRIIRRMQEVQAAAKQQQASVKLVSFSVDPEYDTPPVLAAYAREFNVDTANWRLVTGELGAITKTAVESFKQALEGKAEAGSEHFGIVHGSHLVLIDARRNIRGFYRSSDTDVVSRLVADIKRLNAE